MGNVTPIPTDRSPRRKRRHAGPVHAKCQARRTAIAWMIAK